MWEGLHDENHYSTAKDMAVLMEYALKNETFRKIITSVSYTTSPTNMNPDGITFTVRFWQELRQRILTVEKFLEVNGLYAGGGFVSGKPGN